MKWPSCTYATWWAATRLDWPTRSCTVSSFLSAPGHCSSSYRPSARNGTSVCSTIEITAPTTAACSPASRCPRPPTPISCCTSTNCSTRIRKKPTIRHTGCFWAPNSRVSAAQISRRKSRTVHCYAGAGGLQRAGVRNFLPALRAPHRRIIRATSFNEHRHRGAELLGRRCQFPEKFERIGVDGVGQCSLRVGGRRGGGPDLDGFLALRKRFRGFIAIDQQ